MKEVMADPWLRC